MKYSVELTVKTEETWIHVVLDDFTSFIQDHADCERKASGTSMSLVAKYPDRIKIIPALIETAVEELEHFRDVYAIMESKNIPLRHEIKEDLYIKELLGFCRTGKDERFLDRLLFASVVECRGAERFKLVYENHSDPEIKKFYHRLWASEAGHANLFPKLAMHYFDEKTVFSRLAEINEFEGEIVKKMPFRAALH